MNHSTVFGNVAAQSSNVQSSISNGFQSAPLLNLKFYIDIGTYDIPILIRPINNFLPILQSKGCPYQYQGYHEGHSWGNWRAHINNSLIMFFPGSASVLRTPPNSPQGNLLSQNYTNPFNAVTTITFRILTNSLVSLKIYDLTGREVVVLMSDTFSAGSYEYPFDATGLASGVYLYRLEIGDYVQPRKLFLLPKNSFFRNLPQIRGCVDWCAGFNKVETLFIY